MLQSIRTHAQGWIAGVIVSLICLTFALFGINSYVSSSATVNIAEVNGEDIGLQRYQEAYLQYRRQIQSILGDQTSINDLDQELLKKEALNQMVDAILLEQLESDLGMRIGGAQIAAAINSFQSFHDEDGKFSQDRYTQALRALGMSPAQFESQMGKDLTNEQLRYGIAETAFVTSAEANVIASIRKQKRSLGYAIVTASSFTDAVSFEDADIENFYNENSQQYMNPETVKVSYLLLSLDDLIKDIEVNDEILRDYYDDNLDDYQIKEQRSARHILVHVPNEADEDTIEKARIKAEGLQQRANDGEDFAELAKKFSEDVGSAKDGGETGFFAKGMLIPGFDDKVFEMQPGDISEPVKTAFGWHIIRLEEIQAAGSESFEKAKIRIEQSYRRKQAEGLYYDKVDELGTLAFENPEALEPISDVLGMEIKSSEVLTRAGQELGLFSDRKLITAAFNPEFISENLNSEVIELEGDRLVVMRVEEHQTATLKPLDEVREQAQSGLVEQLSREMAYENGLSFLKRLQQGEDRATVLAEKELKWYSAELVSRDDVEVKRAVLRAAFKIAKPAVEQDVYEGVAIGSGDYALIALTAVKEPEEVKKLELKAAKEELLSTGRTTAWIDFVTELRARADIKTYADRL